MLTCNMQVAQMLHIDHYMTLRPYHSHHYLQKQVRHKMIFTETMISLQQTAMMWLVLMVIPAGRDKLHT
jgi:hypothetical protein